MSTGGIPHKRKREGPNPPHPLEKTEQKKSAKSINLDLKQEIIDCFGVSIESLDEINTTDALFFFCVEEARKLLGGTEHISTEKITRVKQLFFGIDFRSKSVAELQNPLDPINPHPIYVFNSLDDCLAKLTPYSNFSDVVLARRNYIDNDDNSQIKGIIEDPNASIQKVCEFCKKYQNDPEYSSSITATMDKVNECPLYTAQDFFGKDHINEVYILRGETTSFPQWVFKPTAEKYQEGYMLRKGNEDTAVNECTAYALNHHKKFPIPATYFVDIKGYRGSVQLSIDNTQDIEDSDEDQLSVIDMQKILIYDLIFSNTDRHTGNYLFQLGEHNSIRVYGIDHDACMKFDVVEPLKFEYIIFGVIFNQSFMVELEELVSDDNLQKYAKIMEERGIRREAIDWMHYSAGQIKKAIEESISAKEVFYSLRDQFEKENFSTLN